MSGLAMLVIRVRGYSTAATASLMHAVRTPAAAPRSAAIVPYFRSVGRSSQVGMLRSVVTERESGGILREGGSGEGGANGSPAAANGQIGEGKVADSDNQAAAEAEKAEGEPVGVVPSDEELNIMVAQRGSDISRMNGAASHLALAHTIWGQVLRPGGIVVDATCGNGHDSLVLARYLFPFGVSEKVWGHLHCIDIQEAAVESTREQLLVNSGTPLVSGGEPLLDRHVSFHVQNFRSFPDAIEPESVNVLVYNLGYLPGRDKTRTTMARDTVESLRQALFVRPLIAVRGLVSIMCYRGHPEGAKETMAVQDFVEGLDPLVWRTFIHAPLNRPLSPILITIYRLK